MSLRVLKVPIHLPKPAGEQTVEFEASVPGALSRVLSAHVKANGEANIYVEVEEDPNPEWHSDVSFLLVSTGTPFSIPGWAEDYAFVATLQFWGGQAVYHLYHLK